MVSETKLVARYAETDRMGIIHHSVYPVWFEAGRTDFIRKAGIAYSELEDMGILLPLIELKCSYSSHAEYEDDITVTTVIKNLTYTRITFWYRVRRNGEERLVASGETEHVWTDKDLRPLNLKKRHPDMYRLFEGLK